MSTEDYNRLRGYGVPGPNGTLNSKTPGNPAPDNTDKSSDALSLGHAGRVFAYVWSSCAAAYSRVCGYHNTDKSSDAYADFFGLIPAALAGASENGGVPAVPTDEVLTTESGLPKNPAPVNHPDDAWAGYIDVERIHPFDLHELIEKNMHSFGVAEFNGEPVYIVEGKYYVSDPMVPAVTKIIQ